MAHNDSFDEPRFEALYRKLYPDLLRCAEIALRTGGSWYVSVAGRAEEVVQELFAFAWEHQADLWSSASPTGWLYRVLRYKVLELLKEDRFWRKHLIRAAGEMPASPEDDFQQRAEITSILTPEEYEILRKLYLEKYTYEELAREMGLKKSALAMRVKRSKERFVKQWNRTKSFFAAPVNKRGRNGHYRYRGGSRRCHQIEIRRILSWNKCAPKSWRLCSSRNSRLRTAVSRTWTTSWRLWR